jgi:hypothetical protein
MRLVGNMLGFIDLLDNCISVDGESIIGRAMGVIKDVVKRHCELFVVEGGLDLSLKSSPRAFASMWSILEFLMCLPGRIQIKVGESVQPFETFGDGPMFAAQVIITLCGQGNMYRFDSIRCRTLALGRAENSKTASTKICQFIEYAKFAENVSVCANLIAYPYQIQPD